MVNLQDDSCGKKYYVNVSLFLRALDNAPELKEWKGHYRFRFEDRLAPGVNRLLDFEDHDFMLVPNPAGGPVQVVAVHDFNVVSSDEERESRLRAIFEDALVPVMDQLRTLPEIAMAYHGMLERHVLILKTAWNLIFSEGAS